MNLVLSIALTHIRRRIRQTLVAIAGVTTGVGVAIMMAAMMEGSQDDFIKTLVDALPHISVTDELRAPNRQPARNGRGRTLEGLAGSAPDRRAGFGNR